MKASLLGPVLLYLAQGLPPGDFKTELTVGAIPLRSPNTRPLSHVPAHLSNGNLVMCSQGQG